MCCTLSADMARHVPTLTPRIHAGCGHGTVASMPGADMARHVPTLPHASTASRIHAGCGHGTPCPYMGYCLWR